jgi:hypothetical protein
VSKQRKRTEESIMAKKRGSTTHDALARLPAARAEQPVVVKQIRQVVRRARDSRAAKQLTGVAIGAVGGVVGAGLAGGLVYAGMTPRMAGAGIGLVGATGAALLDGTARSFAMGAAATGAGLVTLSLLPRQPEPTRNAMAVHLEPRDLYEAIEAQRAIEAAREEANAQAYAMPMG